MQKNMSRALVLLAASLFPSAQTQAGSPRDAEPFGGAPVQGKPGARSVTLKVGIPSKAASEAGTHAYRPGFERELLSRLCVGAVQCKLFKLTSDPRTPKNSLVPSGLDVLIWGSDIRTNDRADKSAFPEALDGLFEGGDGAAIKVKYMRLKESWPKALVVGTDPEKATRARQVCEKIPAKCTFVVSKNFRALEKRFEAGELNLIIGQSWVFESKDLEDRITATMDR